MRHKRINVLTPTTKQLTQFSLIFFISIMPFFLLAQKQASPNLKYSIPENWLMFSGNNQEHQVDCFYVYPTVFFDDDPANMDILDTKLRNDAMGEMQEQSGVFVSHADIFAPLYRQMSLAVLTLPEDEFDNYFSMAYQDVKAAFSYYLQHHNNGRPFILAGHSQGSMILLQLMKDVFSDSIVMDKLVAAYLIGFSVTSDNLMKYPWLKIAATFDDIGVIITYNTQSADATGSPILMPGAICVNPLNWTTRQDYAPKNLNEGAVFFDENQQINNEILNFTDAEINDDGALIVTSPNPDDYYSPEHSHFPRGVYHAFDYNFFYRNLQQNVEDRIKRYFDQ